jgi:hypothetical protein
MKLLRAFKLSELLAWVFGALAISGAWALLAPSAGDMEDGRFYFGLSAFAIGLVGWATRLLREI